MINAPVEIRREYARFYNLAFPRKKYTQYPAEIIREYNRFRGFAFRAETTAYVKKWLSGPKGKKWKQGRQESERIRSFAKNQTEAAKASRDKYSNSEKGKLVACVATSRYRARKFSADTGLCVERIYARAKELRQWFDVAVDHIIPLAKGGLHSPDNLQIIYRRENCRKGDKLNYSPAVVFV